jgi:hypothetical protein
VARIGLYPTLIVVVFGVVVPFFIFKLGRLIGFKLFLGLAFAIGLAYGAVKAEYPWHGQGLVENAVLMAMSGLLLVAYVALSFSAARLVSRAASSLRR